MFSFILGVIAVLSLFFDWKLTKYPHHDKVEIMIVEEFEIKDSWNELDELILLLTEEEKDDEWTELKSSIKRKG